MSGAWIRRRPIPAGVRNPKPRVSYQVLYRRGGRGYRIETAGTFKTQTEARDRRDLVAGWLARGTDPRVELAKLQQPTAPARSREQWRDAWLASCVNLADSTLTTYRAGVNAVFARLRPGPLEQITVADCADAAVKLVDAYAANTAHTYWTPFELLLDYAGLEPNPAQDRRIKLPSTKGAPPTPPTREHVEAMLGRLPGKYVMPFVLLEQTGVRVETVEELDWANVDLPGRRARVFEKGRGAKKVRWVQLPDWYADLLADAAPPDARTGRVFPGVTADGLYSAMRAVCRAAGIPHYHPHDLRHRRVSLWHLQGVPDAVLSARVGHSRASFTKDVYAHVMPVDEVPAARLWTLIAGGAR